MKIPFNWWPGHWGLKGKTRERARIDYEYDEGYEKEKALLRLRYEDSTNDDYKQAKLELEYKFNRIKERDYELKKIDFIEDKINREIAKLAWGKKYSVVTEQEYQKEVATLKGEPWVYIPEISFDKEDPSYGGFHIDCNDAFIEYLREHGYDAPDTDQILNDWMNDICRNIALEEFDGIGDFNDRLDDIDSRTRIDDERWFKE